MYLDIFALIGLGIVISCLFIQERYWAFKIQKFERQIDKECSRLRNKEFQLDCVHYDISELIIKLEAIIDDLPEDEREFEDSAYHWCLRELEYIRDKFK